MPLEAMWGYFNSKSMALDVDGCHLASLRKHLIFGKDRLCCFVWQKRPVMGDYMRSSCFNKAVLARSVCAAASGHQVLRNIVSPAVGKIPCASRLTFSRRDGQGFPQA